MCRTYGSTDILNVRLVVYSAFCSQHVTVRTIRQNFLNLRYDFLGCSLIDDALTLQAPKYDASEEF